MSMCLLMPCDDEQAAAHVQLLSVLLRAAQRAASGEVNLLLLSDSFLTRVMCAGATTSRLCASSSSRDHQRRGCHWLVQHQQQQQRQHAAGLDTTYTPTRKHCQLFILLLCSLVCCVRREKRRPQLDDKPNWMRCRRLPRTIPLPPRKSRNSKIAKKRKCKRDVFEAFWNKINFDFFILFFIFFYKNIAAVIVINKYVIIGVIWIDDDVSWTIIVPRVGNKTTSSAVEIYKKKKKEQKWENLASGFFK